MDVGGSNADAIGIFWCGVGANERFQILVDFVLVDDGHHYHDLSVLFCGPGGLNVDGRAWILTVLLLLLEIFSEQACHLIGGIMQCYSCVNISSTFNIGDTDVVTFFVLLLIFITEEQSIVGWDSFHFLQ